MRNKVKVACLGYVFDRISEPIIRELAPDGFELLFIEKPDETMPARLADCDFILCVSPVTGVMMAGAPRLKLVQKWGIGVDKIDLAAADKLGVYVSIAAGANAGIVAEHTVMLILAALRRLVTADRQIRGGRWSTAELRPEMRQLAGKTVGLLGFGNIGRAVAKRLQGFDVRLIYHDIAGPFTEVAERLDARFVDFPDLLAQSDILSLHIPGGPKNRHIIDAAALARLRPGAVVVNAARGELVAERALVEALRSGHLLAAALDTFEHEPLPQGSALRDLDQMTLTPHAAGTALDHVAAMAEHCFRNLRLFLADEPLPPADWIVVPRHPRAAYGAAPHRA